MSPPIVAVGAYRWCMRALRFASIIQHARREHKPNFVKLIPRFNKSGVRVVAMWGVRFSTNGSRYPSRTCAPRHRARKSAPPPFR